MNVFRRFVLPGAALAALALCCAVGLAGEPKASQKLLQGQWTGVVTIDDEAFKSDENLKDVPPEQVALVMKTVKEQFSKMKIKLNFDADGETTAEFDAPGVPAKERKQTGTWEVVKTDGPNITIKVTPATDDDDDEEGDDDEEDKKTAKKGKGPEEMTLRFVDEKTITATELGDKLPKGVTFTFTKK